ncbi:hypothetical protein JCM5296_002211 [Sporobolomyces johnsonii]
MRRSLLHDEVEAAAFAAAEPELLGLRNPLVGHAPALSWREWVDLVLVIVELDRMKLMGRIPQKRGSYANALGSQTSLATVAASHSYENVAALIPPYRMARKCATVLEVLVGLVVYAMLLFAWKHLWVILVVFAMPLLAWKYFWE